ncbi:MAG: PKD domain-containing protein [Candidatus Pacearchaeota archaeon]|jgi:PKD repeat protein
MMKKRGFVVLSLAVFLSAFVCASFNIGEPSHSTSSIYGPGADFTGWVNLSFNDEPANSSFEDSFGNLVSLGTLANNTPGFIYTCTTTNCVPDYFVSNPETSKSFSFGSRDSEIIGLRVSGEIQSITSISFNIESDASSSCYNQVSLDILDDGVIDYGNDKALLDVCGFLKSYGCFNETEDFYNPAITNLPYCQRISLFGSAGLKLGAWVYEEEGGNKDLTMALYTLDGDFKRSCDLPKENITANGSEVSCDVDYMVATPSDYYVCLYSDEGDGEYRTRGYSSGELCGFNGFPVKGETNSYQLFAQTRAFASVGVLNVSNVLPGGNSFSGLVNNYLFDRYGGLNCSNGCIIPIRIISGKDQELTIDNLKLIHSKPGLVGIEENNFYALGETPSLLSADFQKLHLDGGGFILPGEYGSFDFTLKFNDEQIFSKTISIEDVPLIGNIYPSKTASAFPTLFIVPILNNNSASFEWDFGDGETGITPINQVTHTYASSGDYTLGVTVVDSLGRSSFKEFDIEVVSPENLINTTFIKKTRDLKNVKLQIEGFDSFYQERLNSFFDFEFFEDELKRLKKDYGDSFFEEEYNQIMTDLLDLQIPELVLTTKSANSIAYFPREEYIDLYILETVGGGIYDIDRTDEYLKAILSWNQENLGTKITFKEISARYVSHDEPILRFFEIDVSPKEEFGREPYFIIENLDDLYFDGDYLESEESGFTYFLLEGEETVSFSTTEDVDFTNLPFFISPEIDELLSAKVTSVQEEETFSRWVLFGSILSLLILIGLIVYVVLQRWYKNRYETYLFKNRNNLYNLVVYIQNSRKKGVKDKDIYSKLRKAGWNSEQVNYAMKKHAGKRTGMFELPIGKVLDKLKKKGVLDKKQNKNPFNRFNQRRGFRR